MTVAAWLELAAAWRFGSLLFQPPSDEHLAELRALAAEVAPERRSDAATLVAFSPEDWPAEFHRVLGPGGWPASESSYDDNALAGRGPLLSRVAAFYEAFAYRPDDLIAEVPDHISVELGFLSYLALKCAYAASDNNTAAGEVASDAYQRFIDDHLRWWIDRLSERIQGTESPLYIGACVWALSLLTPGELIVRAPEHPVGS